MLTDEKSMLGLKMKYIGQLNTTCDDRNMIKHITEHPPRRPQSPNIAGGPFDHVFSDLLGQDGREIMTEASQSSLHSSKGKWIWLKAGHLDLVRKLSVGANSTPRGGRKVKKGKKKNEGLVLPNSFPASP